MLILPQPRANVLAFSHITGKVCHNAGRCCPQPRPFYRSTHVNMTATQTYTQRREEIARLLDVIQMELDAHGERAAADPANWGFAGDLGKVRSDLIAMVEFITNHRMTRADIEKFLDESE